MATLLGYLKAFYVYGSPNFYMPQCMLDAFALVLFLVFTAADPLPLSEYSLELDNSLPVNRSPFGRDLADPSPTRQLIFKNQDIHKVVVEGFRSAKMELLVTLMFRPELPLLSRTTTYEVADGEALLLLVLEKLVSGVDGAPEIDIVEESKDTLLALVRCP